MIKVVSVVERYARVVVGWDCFTISWFHIHNRIIPEGVKRRRSEEKK